jgi:hypothetical protein
MVGISTCRAMLSASETSTLERVKDIRGIGFDSQRSYFYIEGNEWR